MTTISTIVAPIAPRGFAKKAGALVAGTAFAGAALLGGTVVAPTVTASLTGSVQHDYVLTADPTGFPTFTESLQSLLTVLDIGTMGQVLGKFGEGIDTSSTISALLAALNPTSADLPNGVTLDAATFGMLSTDITALLNDVQMPIGGGATAPLGDIPIDQLIGGFIGGAGADTSIGTLLGFFGLGDYAGLLDLPFAGLSPTDTLSELLSSMLGIDASTSINDLLAANEMGDATIASLMGISPEQLSAGWDQFVDGIVLGGTLSDPDGTGTLGAMSLGDLLGSLVGSTVTDDTTLTDFLGGLDLFGMLGLS